MFFFFQAEDGIRDVAVTGVQTCALPILVALLQDRDFHTPSVDGVGGRLTPSEPVLPAGRPCSRAAVPPLRYHPGDRPPWPSRSGPHRSSRASARSRARGP